jgi:peptide chain release factor 2
VDDGELLHEMATEANDPAEIAEAEKSFADAEKGIAALEFKRMLSGKHDTCNALLIINSGAGGTESQDWASILMRMYYRWAERKGFKTEMLDELPGEEAGIKNATLRIEGPYAYGFLRAEIGIHRLVRISPFDSNKRRHTSFASIFVYPELEDDSEIEVNEKDIRIDVFRASGAGGQKVNKTSSAIRITHLPTGIAVQCQNERSQHQNRDQAMKMLKARLYDLREEEKRKESDTVENTKRDIGWGSQIRSYVMQPYRMVKDVRTGEETSDVNSVLDGDIDPFIEAYLMGKRSERAMQLGDGDEI